MMKRLTCIVLVSITLIAAGCQGEFGKAAIKDNSITIVYPARASKQEILAAKEIRRYLYLRSDKLVSLIENDGTIPSEGDLIVIGQKDKKLIKRIARADKKLRKSIKALEADESRIKTLRYEGRTIVLIAGGDKTGALYGAYRFLEHFGIRFQLHVDAIPDKKISLTLPDIDETHKPLFNIRGLNTWGAHAEGLDAWDSDKFKAVFTQMTKMGMNSMVIHSYPEHAGLGTEPVVWIGLPEDVDENGDVLFSSDSTYWNTKRRTWGYQPSKTGDYRFGGSLLFESDDWGSWLMGGQFPSAKEFYGRNEVFNRTGDMYKDAFTFARQMGVKTTLGTEAGVPAAWNISKGEKITMEKYGPSIGIPNRVKERLIEKGMDPKDPAVLQKIYEGIFSRIDKKHPLDYYILYTQEFWYWKDMTREMFDSFVEEFNIAYRAWEKVNPEFDLAVCGWVLGPDFNHAAFDKALPKHVAISEMSRAYNAPVDEGFGRMQEGRPRWAIPWIEEDSPIMTPSLWASRVRKDAADALAYDCTGLMTLHWRTRILEPSSAAMAKACWDQSGWNPEFGKANPGVPESTFKMPERTAGAEGASYEQGPNGGTLADMGAIAISNTEDDRVYQSNRFDIRGYGLKVPNGKYKVVLKFCDPFFNSAGKRIFDVSLQDKTVYKKLDIFAEVGIYAALDLSFDDIMIEDNNLKIGFNPIVSSPCIMGVEIYGDGYSRKVNVGGEDYKDYEGDIAFWRPTPVLMWGEIGSEFEPRGLPVDDFYANWCGAMFGEEAGNDAGKFFSKLDSHIPLVADWTGAGGGGAGGLAPDGRGWDKVSQEYRFVDEFEKIRRKVCGEGSLERFDYWLNNFRYTRATAHAECLWGELSSAFNKARMAKTEEEKKALARKLVLPVYKELVAEIGNALKYHMATISTVGGMQTVLNWEGHNKLLGIDASGNELAKMLGEELPKDAIATKEYQGEPRIIVPTVRTVLNKGENLTLKVIVLDNSPAESAKLYYRTIGERDFSKIDIKHINRAVYTVSVSNVSEDFEYYIKAKTTNGKTLVWPATAGKMNQSIVVIP